MAEINVLGSRIHYEIIGSGIPVIMLHGWGMDMQIMTGCMEPVFEGSKKEFKRIYIDLPGMGKSVAGDNVRTSDDILETLFVFIDKVIKKESFLIVGESYGGYLSRAMIQKRPSKILGAILICPLMVPGYRKGNVEELAVIKEDKELLESLTEEERTRFEYITVIRTKKVWERYKADVLEALRHMDLHFLNDVLEGALSYDVDVLRRPFDKPSLILTGRYDCEVGYKDQFTLMDKYKKGTYMVFDEAGHNLQFEQPTQFTSAVLEWLAANFN